MSTTADDDLRAIRTFPELLGYLVAVSRERGWDEVAAVDRFIIEAEPDRERVDEAESVLRSLGYVAVADRLKKLRHNLKPKQPGRWPRR